MLNLDVDPSIFAFGMMMNTHQKNNNKNEKLIDFDISYQNMIQIRNIHA